MNYNIINPRCFEAGEIKYVRRPDIGELVVFCHFSDPVSVFLGKERTDILPGGCLFWDAHSNQHYEWTDTLSYSSFVSDSSAYPLFEKYGIEFNTVYYPSNHDEITHLIELIEIENNNKSKFYHQAMDTYAEQIFIILSRANKLKMEISAKSSQQVEAFNELRSIIRLNCQLSWSIEGMAKLVHLSPPRFYGLYKKIFGISPRQDLIQKRIQVAQKLLLEDKKTSITKISESIGYSNQYHFIRQFKQLTGITPGQYRQNPELAAENVLPEDI